MIEIKSAEETLRKELQSEDELERDVAELSKEVYKTGVTNATTAILEAVLPKIRFVGVSLEEEGHVYYSDILKGLLKQLTKLQEEMK